MVGKFQHAISVRIFWHGLGTCGCGNASYMVLPVPQQCSAVLTEGNAEWYQVVSIQFFGDCTFVAGLLQACCSTIATTDK